MDKEFLIDKHTDAALCIIILCIELVFLLYAFYSYFTGEFGSECVRKVFRVYFYVLLVWHVIVSLWVGLLIGKIVVKDTPYGWSFLDAADEAIKNYYFIVMPV